jgi:CRISPR-associated protein Cas5h
MLGSAVGWNEEEFLKKLDKLKYGIIIESPGELLKEIARILKGENEKIYPISKNMLYKPRFSLFVASEEDMLIDKIFEAIKDPKYVLSLGDSENLFYPMNTEFVKRVDIKPVSSDKFRCILPTEVYKNHKGYSIINSEILPPKEIRIPVNFTGSGKSRRFVSKSVVFYSGIEVNMKENISENVWEFDGSPIYLF